LKKIDDALKPAVAKALREVTQMPEEARRDHNQGTAIFAKGS